MPSAINPASLAALFKEQGTLSVKDALVIIHETQDLMNEEPNMVRVEGATIYGAFTHGVDTVGSVLID